MHEAIKKLCRDPFCLWIMVFVTVFLSLGASLLILSWSRIPPQVPLFLNRPWGEEQLVPKAQILILPIFAFLFFSADTLIAIRFFSKEPLLARILIGTGCLLVIIFTIALFQLVILTT